MSEVTQALESMNTAFAEFKATVDQRFEQVKKDGAPRSDTEEKLDNINAEMDRLTTVIADVEKKAARPGAGTGPDPDTVAYNEAFAKFMRKGHDHDLNNLAIKASLKTTVDGDGGFAVPEVIDTTIQEQLVDISPMREIADVQEVGTSDYKRLVNTKGTASGWVGETAARPETGTPTLAEVAPTMGELYANPAATQNMLDDVFFDAERWLGRDVVQEFGRQEGAAFITGDGTNKPTGFLDGTPVTTADASRAFGVLQYFPSGAAGAFAGTDPHNALINVVYGIKQGYRQNARWVAARSTLAEVRKMKDGDGNLIWQPGLAAGQPQTLMGYPITEAEDMPAIAANSFSMAFGDFRRGYLIVDRMGTRVLRDPFTNKPYVHFYTTKRVGGITQDSDAIKLLRMAAS